MHGDCHDKFGSVPGECPAYAPIPTSSYLEFGMPMCGKTNGQTMVDIEMNLIGRGSLAIDLLIRSGTNNCNVMDWLGVE